MKSFDKFQFDSSPVIDEEMEDLDESLVGAVRSAGQVIGNKLKDTGKALQRAQQKASTLTSRAASKVQSVQKNLNKKIENVASRTKPKTNLLDKSGSFTGVKPVKRTQRQKDDFADRLSSLKAKGTLNQSQFNRDTSLDKNKNRNPGVDPENLGTRYNRMNPKASRMRNLTRGGFNSSLARTAGAAGKRIFQGLAQKPDKMVSYNSPGTGSLGAFQGLGGNVQSAAKNAMTAPRFQPTTTVKNKDGTITKTVGKDDGRTIGSTIKNKVTDKLAGKNVSPDSVLTSKPPKKDEKDKVGSQRVTTSKFQDTGEDDRKIKADRAADRKFSNDPKNKLVQNQIKKASQNKSVKRELDKDPEFREFGKAPSSRDISSFSSQEIDDLITQSRNKNKKSNTSQKKAQDQLGDIVIGSKPSEKESEQQLVNRLGGTRTSSQTTGTGNRGGQKRFKNFNKPKVTTSKSNVGGQTSKNNVFNQSKKPTSKSTVTSSQTTGTGNKGGQTKKNNAMQQYINDLNQDDQNSKNKKNNRFSNNRPIRDEFEFSHWREEFLWEVDKKYPEKVKEIKPMTGKNTITVNPEDKGAKYKRGY